MRARLFGRLGGVIFLTLVAVIFLSSSAMAKSLKLRPAKVEVVDGDSINYGKRKFRLCGINAPERNKYWYRRSGELLKRLLKARKIDVHIVDVDKYGRSVVVIFTFNKNISINEKMVEAGGAIHYKRYSKNCAPWVSVSKFSKAEKRAKQKRLGIWRR